MRQELLVLVSAVFFIHGAAYAQSADVLKPGVREYVAVDAPVVALTHVRVIDGTGGPIREDQTIVIEGDKVRAVGAFAQVTVPAGARVLDLAGHTVIPGIVGMHNHTYYPAGGDEHNMLSFSAPRLYLASGVTTVRTTGSIDPYRDLNLKKAIEVGETPGPKMHVTGPYLQGPGPGPKVLHALKDAHEARRMVAYWAEEGVTWFKAYTQVSRAALASAIAEAHNHGIKVTAHLCSVTFREAAELGIDNLEHGLGVTTDFTPGKNPDSCPTTPRADVFTGLDLKSEPVQSMIKLLVGRKIPITSTISAGENSLPGRPPFDQRVLDALVGGAREAAIARRAQAASNPNAERQLAVFKKAMEFEREFVRAGGLLAAGMDPSTGHLPGFGDQRNFPLFIEAGFTPSEAVQIMSLNGARVLGVSDKIGSIAAGKQADLVVIRADLPRSPDDIKNVTIVFKDGVGYDSLKLIDSVKGMVGLR
jgi:imidazolonepropionase-like amidohydrolase